MLDMRLRMEYPAAPFPDNSKSNNLIYIYYAFRNSS